MLHEWKKTCHRIRILEGERYLLLKVIELRKRNKNAVKCYIRFNESVTGTFVRFDTASCSLSIN